MLVYEHFARDKKYDRCKEVDWMRKDETIGFQIRCTANLVSRFIENSHKGDDSGESKVTKMQGWIIDYIFDHRDEPIYQRDIEKEFSIRRSTATELLKLMEKNGLITRESVPNDLRLKKLILTEKSLNKHKEMKKKIKEIESVMSEGISDEEKQIFFSVMVKIRENILNSEKIL